MNKSFVVGVAGGSASGKSTFADAIEKELKEFKTFTIHMDSYFKPEEERPYVKASVCDVMYVDDNHPLTMDLSKLFEDLKEAIQSGNYEIIIVEGLLTLWDKNIYDLLDLKLFVDCQADERIVRRLKRNMQWGLTFDQISSVYLDMVRYRHDEFVEPSKWKADLILNGSLMSQQATEIVVGFIKSKI